MVINLTKSFNEVKDEGVARAGATVGVGTIRTTCAF